MLRPAVSSTALDSREGKVRCAPYPQILSLVGNRYISISLKPICKSSSEKAQDLNPVGEAGGLHGRGDI